MPSITTPPRASRAFWTLTVSALLTMTACTAPNPLFQPDPCETNSDCLLGEACVQSECVDVDTSCDEDLDCLLGQRCENRVCTSGDSNNDPGNNDPGPGNNDPGPGNNDPGNNDPSPGNNDPGNNDPSPSNNDPGNNDPGNNDPGPGNNDPGPDNNDPGPGVCEPGMTRCVANTVQTCLDNGEGFGESVPCEDDEACFDGRCVFQGCEIGARDCDGDTVLVCNEDGRFEPTQDCTNFGRTCQDGECVEDDDCAIAVATLNTIDLPPATELTVEPDTNVRLDAGGSFRAANFSWAVVERPEGSLARIIGSMREVAQFTPDLTGIYVFELTVSDENDVPGCETARVTLTAQGSEQGISIELIWETPDDPNPNDERGGDLDLHFLNFDRARAWNQAPWDCYYQNTNPDWGRPGRSVDNPALTQDDDNGGPERIELAEPEEDVAYLIGVHYFRDSDLGASLFTLRISIDGVLVEILEESPLQRSGDFNTAFEVFWSDPPEIELINEVSGRGFPEID